MDFRFFYLGQEAARVYLLATAPSHVSIEANRADIRPEIRLIEPRGGSTRPAAGGSGAARFDLRAQGSCGIYALELSPAQGAENEAHNATVSLAATGSVAPFLLPRPGVTPSHFPGLGAPLWFPENEQGTRLWIPVPEGLDEILIHTIGLHADTNEPVLYRLDGGPWAPLPFRGNSHHRGAPLSCRGATLCELDVRATKQRHRLSVAQGLPIFLSAPPARLPFGAVRIKVETERGRDAGRVDFYWCGRPISTAFADEKHEAVCHALPGAFTAVASRGMFYEKRAAGFVLKQGRRVERTITLGRRLERPAGYVCGDCHMHSWAIDGAHDAETIAASARAESLDFIFLTDDDPKEAEVERFSVAGRFLAMAGQEAHCADWHINVLGSTEPVRDESWGNAAISALEVCRAAGKQSTPEKPVGVMLNHPHFSGRRPEGAERNAYFYSWHVLDEAPEISAVENFNFEGWFEQLNSGRRVAAVWTTDSHDAVLYPIGARRTFCNTGGRLDQRAVIEALTAGRSFVTRNPGAFVLLRAGGAEPGDTVKVASGETIAIEVECRSTVPISRIELIRNGTVFEEIAGGGAQVVRSEAILEPNGERGWIIARVKLHEPPLHASSHESEPLTNSGYAAFTNPIYLEAT